MQNIEHGNLSIASIFEREERLIHLLSYKTSINSREQLKTLETEIFLEKTKNAPKTESVLLVAIAS